MSLLHRVITCCIICIITGVVLKYVPARQADVQCIP